MFYKSRTDFSCNDNSECLVNGTCAINPGLSSSQEIIVLYLKELAFYLTKLKSFGITNNGIKDRIIEILFGIVINVNYKEEDYNNTLVILSKYLGQSKALYEKFCHENEINIENPPVKFKHLKNYDLAAATAKGEKYFLKRMLHMNADKRGYYSIIIFLCKSLSVKIVEMQRLGGNYDDAFYTIMELMNVIVPFSFDKKQIKEEFYKALDSYYSLTDEIYNIKEQLYGKPFTTNVSMSSRVGKAILVSGTDIKKLEEILNVTKGKNIDVYTHGLEMLTSHCYPKIKEYENLVGHFGSGLESCIVDFASFPGAILMTKGSLQCVDFLYRGRLYTLDPIPSTGVIKIENNNYDVIVKSALEAKGFKHAKEKPDIPVGFNEKTVLKKFDEIFDRLINKDIRHLYIVGLANYFRYPEPYYEEFLQKIPKDCFAISFSFDLKKDNVFHINTLYDYLLMHKILNKLKKKVDFRNLNMSVFLTTADKQIIFNLLYLKHLGIKNVYMGDVPTSLIIPVISDVLKSDFGIKQITTPEIDIENTLAS